MQVSLNKSVFFERVLPGDFDLTNVAVTATQRRFALEDAIKCGDLLRSSKAVEEYSNEFYKIMHILSKNKTSIVLKEQPLFEWYWTDNGENASFMSPCWQWEKTMIHACACDINMRIALNHAHDEEWKLANRYLQTSGQHAATIVSNVLGEWTWKEDQSVLMTFPEYWRSKLNFIYGLKDMFTLQFAYKTNGLANNNGIKLLNRAEKNSNLSIVEWANGQNASLMNWARVGRAFLTAKRYAENEEVGKSIGMVNTWEPMLNTLEKTDKLAGSMKTIVSTLKDIAAEKSGWINANDHIHYQKIEVPELVKYEVDDDHKNINPLY